MTGVQYFLAGFATLCVLGAVYLRKTTNSEGTVGALLFIAFLAMAVLAP